ncbi:extracellular mutant protein 11-domain-containing protein [Hypoxylon sp. FL1284]|nr:extracellular mutant protein 11-domain-containing protein [Hypoxylon sp. FL1284]
MCLSFRNISKSVPVQMPPASQFLKHSKTKMQAWVTSNGRAPNQASPAAPGPGPGPGHDGYGQTNIPQRHVYLPQSTMPVTQQQQQQQQLQQQQQQQPTQAMPNSPPRSRAPIVNANSNRAAAVAAARLPVPTSRSGHARDASLNMSRARGFASEPNQTADKRGPFWDGSTADGSMFSDTASNGNASTAATSMYRVPFRGPAYQRGETPRPRLPAKQQEAHSLPDQHPPFLMGHNGIMDVVGGSLTRSASTPDTRRPRNRSHVISSPEPDLDQDSEDGAYHTSPEKTPSAKRLHHTKPLAPHPLAMRTNRRGSFSERANYSNNYPQGENMTTSPRAQVYQGPENGSDEGQLGQLEHPANIRVKTQDVRRSTIFADTDTPIASHPDESDHESVEPEPTPKPVPRATSDVSRKLFGNGARSGLGLDESAMPRPAATKRTSNTRKRQREQDYDDSTLAAMNYAELRNEAFDFDPAREEAQSAIGPPRGTLPEKLNHFLDKDQASQLEFFAKMPVRDWEASGDWLLDRFGEVVQQFKRARQSKRAMIENFENEIANRGDAVRTKIQGIDKTLTEFKREGEGMMVGKDFE